MIKTTLFAAVAAAALTAAPASAAVMTYVGTADGGLTQIGPNAGTSVTSTISVLDDFLITDINVEVNLEHTWVGDLDIDLIGPDLTTVRLMGDNGLFVDGSSGDDLVMTIFDDEALVSITTAQAADAPYTQSWIPREALSIFDGTSSLGDWTLRITDTVNVDGGTFGNWRLTIEGEPVDVSEPGALGLLGLGLAGLAVGRRRRQ